VKKALISQNARISRNSSSREGGADGSVVGIVRFLSVAMWRG
jgi:hypothetical protein